MECRTDRPGSLVSCYDWPRLSCLPSLYCHTCLAANQVSLKSTNSYMHWIFFGWTMACTIKVIIHTMPSSIIWSNMNKRHFTMQALQSSTFPYQEYVWERKRGEKEDAGGRAWKNGDGGGDEDGDWPLFCCRVCCIDLFDCILFHLYQCTKQILFIGLNHTMCSCSLDFWK